MQLIGIGNSWSNVFDMSWILNKEPNKYRMIHHLSYLKGISVNDHILPEMKSVNYIWINDAISTIQLYDSPVYMTNCDIEMAYRNLPLSPSGLVLF
jgi:hypothetical protein